MIMKKSKSKCFHLEIFFQKILILGDENNAHQFDPDIHEKQISGKSNLDFFVLFRVVLFYNN